MRSRRHDPEVTSEEMLARLEAMHPVAEREFVATSATFATTQRAAPNAAVAPRAAAADSAWVVAPPPDPALDVSHDDLGGWVPRQAESVMGEWAPDRPPSKPRLLTIPAPLRMARLTPSVQSVLGTVVLVVLVAVVFGAKAANAARDSSLALDTSSESRGTATSTVAAGDSGGAANGSPAPAAGAGGRVVVHIAGAVAKPGVVRLPAGSRVTDALKAAGGPTGKADLDGVNLARAIVDGEQILVPIEGQAPSAGGSSSVGGASQTLSLNSATPAELEELPGVGPVIAGRIVEWRTTNGGFTTVDDLTQVRGIGEAMLADLRPLVRP